MIRGKRLGEVVAAFQAIQADQEAEGAIPNPYNIPFKTQRTALERSLPAKHKHLASGIIPIRTRWSALWGKLIGS